MKATNKVVLINHQPIVLEGLIRIVGEQDFLKLTGCTLPSWERSKPFILQHPDLVLLDSEEIGSLLEMIGNILEISPSTRVIVFAAAGNADFAVRALEAGAAGYVSTTSTMEELMTAARCVLAGDTFISPKIAVRVINSLRAAAIRKTVARQGKLNYREEQIACLLLKGKTNRQIADTLGLSEKTVKHYMHHLMQKLNAKNRLELALVVKAGPGSETYLVN